MHTVKVACTRGGCMSEWIGLFIMAMALGMDAFSIALGMGMLGLRLIHMFRIGLVVGLFHVLMPMGGIVVGKFLSLHFDFIATLLGGIVLFLIGLHMVVSSFGGKTKSIRPFGWGLVLFALSVSLDSFSVGLSLGMLGAKTIITVMMLGAISMVLSWIGLLIGARFQRFIGSYGELLGGFILIGFGMKLFFPV